MNASTPTYYDALEVPPSASQDRIRKQYQRLVLQHHPDKAPQKAEHASISKTRDTAERFRSVVAAYEVLGDPDLRAAYDEELAGRSAAKLGPLHAEVDLDDMQHDSAAELFSMPCRCGGSYVIREEELEDGVDIVGCSTCSLRIRVLYAEAEQEPSMGA